MGKKNPTEALENIASSPSIFQSLFGEISEHDDSTSIFSDTNPFRRKPTDSIAQNPSSLEGAAEPEIDGSENLVVVETKTRKRKADGRVGVDSDSVGEGSELVLVNKKAKKMKDNSPDFGFQVNSQLVKDKFENLDLGLESNGGKNPNFGFVVGEMGSLKIEKEQKKKKKRKRDEIEKEYEEKRYGAATEVEDGDGVLGRRVVGEKRKAVDDAAKVLVPQEGFDDESKLLRTVFVGNLPLKLKKKALLKEFSQFGEIESLRIRSVPIVDSKIPRKGAILKKKINDSIDSVHAYIVFKMEQSAQASLAHNMSLVGGNHIRVDKACPPRKKLKGESAPLYDSRRTVFLGNLPFDVKDEEIYQLFSSMSQLESCIEAVRVIRDSHTSVGKGIAYVLFKTREAANFALKKRHLKLRDRELRLTHTKSDSTPSKRKNPSTSQAVDNFPAKKMALDSSSPQDGYERRKAKASMSYQGLRGSKSGSQEKIRRKTVEAVHAKSTTPRGEKPKERKDKRPAVAARKAKQIALQNAGASKVAGQKRRHSRTPESARRNKKAKKSN